MKSVTMTWTERHFEKIACLAAGIVLCWSAAHYALQSPNCVIFQERALAPGELLPALYAEAHRLDERLDSAAAVRVESLQDSRFFVQRHEGGVLGELDQDAAGLSGRVLPIACGFNPLIDIAGIVSKPVKTITPHAPAHVRASTGRCVSGAPVEKTDTTGDGGTAGSEVGWVRITGLFDFDAQQRAFLAAGYPDYAARVHLAALEIERCERLSNDDYSAWKSIGRRATRAHYPRAVFDELNKRWLNRDEIAAAFKDVREGQHALMRPAFAVVLTGDAPTSAPAATNSTGETLENPNEIFWFDDLTTKPGGVYRYRARILCWNRLVGRLRDTIDPADAEQALLIGAWSVPTDPVIAAPQTRYFLMGPNLEADGITVEVWKWRLGKWTRRNFSVRLGEEIGAPCRVKLAQAAPDDRQVFEEIDMRTGVRLLAYREVVAAKRVTEEKSGRFCLKPTAAFSAVFVGSDGATLEERDATEDRTCPERKRLLAQ